MDKKIIDVCCESSKGLYYGDNVDDAGFDGCEEWHGRSVENENN